MLIYGGKALVPAPLLGMKRSIRYFALRTMATIPHVDVGLDHRCTELKQAVRSFRRQMKPEPCSFTPRARDLRSPKVASLVRDRAEGEIGDNQAACGGRSSSPPCATAVGVHDPKELASGLPAAPTVMAMHGGHVAAQVPRMIGIAKTSEIGSFASKWAATTRRLKVCGSEFVVMRPKHLAFPARTRSAARPTNTSRNPRIEACRDRLSTRLRHSRHPSGLEVLAANEGRIADDEVGVGPSGGRGLT